MSVEAPASDQGRGARTGYSATVFGVFQVPVQERLQAVPAAGGAAVPAKPPAVWGGAARTRPAEALPEQPLRTRPPARARIPLRARLAHPHNIIFSLIQSQYVPRTERRTADATFREAAGRVALGIRCVRPVEYHQRVRLRVEDPLVEADQAVVAEDQVEVLKHEQYAGQLVSELQGVTSAW